MPDAPQQGKYITYEELDEGAIVRILLNRPRPAMPRTAACWSSWTRPSTGPRRTTRSGW